MIFVWEVLIVHVNELRQFKVHYLCHTSDIAAAGTLFNIFSYDDSGLASCWASASSTNQNLIKAPKIVKSTDKKNDIYKNLGDKGNKQPIVPLPSGSYIKEKQSLHSEL